MTSQIQKLYDVWLSNRTAITTSPAQISFDDLTNSIISTGAFSFFIIDFFDMSLSHISPSFYEIHGFDPETISFNDILGAIHPEDIDFVVKAEAFLTHFFSEKISREKLLSYKISYSYRARLKNGKYALFNHQAVMLSIDDHGGYGKSLNINTRIDHLSNSNTYKISLIGLNGEPSFMTLSLDEENQDLIEFSKREIDIIKLISNGLNNVEIAEKLFISPLTVKKHRNNILTKSNSKNTAQLIKNCIFQGLI
ncbi:LuxR C-terminal-related transcriptional regulator [Flavobacterium granuli]|uniref:PAS domain-containing protein n=1 Tax=Flavobacterium granuli TaxID=280093 RepID=A0A1M5NJG6_9FLAO|nr:LuxR C-terminal-related transcriptional regulator [Flavobacterium granuli]PRZ23305.1 PAS domain-containing protein [Flavobacterium granuli]SHG89690.1 PAS fold-containing protein [Flavobacterium granuli]